MNWREINYYKSFIILIIFYIIFENMRKLGIAYIWKSERNSNILVIFNFCINLYDKKVPNFIKLFYFILHSNKSCIPCYFKIFFLWPI